MHLKQVNSQIFPLGVGVHHDRAKMTGQKYDLR